MRLVTIIGILCITICVRAAEIARYSEEALGDEIHNLPGLPGGATSFRQFSGYVNVSSSRRLFYWFVESQSGRNPTEDPVLLWTNGGPGCSGLGGFVSEQGPFRVAKNLSLVENPYAWNKLANIIFIEQPAGVGFSVNDDMESFAYGDQQAAEDNWKFIQGWFAKFPNYKRNPFFLTSESYGGHYLPTLAYEIVSKNTPDIGINFRGFAVGNPLTYMPYRNLGEIGTYGYHNLLPKPEFDAYLKHACYDLDTDRPQPKEKELCSDLLDSFENLVADMDPYALDFPVCETTKSAGRAERHQLLKFIRGSKVGQRGILGDAYFPDAYEPCTSNWGNAYLNQPSVQRAIHVEGENVTWSDCSNSVGQKYSINDTNVPMMPFYQKLIEGDANLNILVYSGDDDAVCATLGSQQWIWDLGYDVSDPWKSYKYEGQVAGFSVAFTSKGKKKHGFRFATVHGAGHMVPSTRPAQSLEVIRRFLEGW